MDKIAAFFSTPAGAWLARAAVVAFGALINSGDIPLDYVIPGIHLSVGQVLPWIAPLIPSGKK